MDVQTGQAREKLLAEDQGQLDLVLSADGRDPDHAGMDSDAALMWQYQTPAEQWETMFGQKGDR